MRRLDGAAVSKKRLALRASPRAEARYVRDLRAIAKGIVETTESAMAPEIAHRGTREDVASVSKHGAKLDTVIGGLRVHLARVVPPAFDRMSAEVSKKNAAGMKLLGIQPVRSGLSPVVAMARDENIRLVENAAREYAGSVREVFDDPDNFGLRVEELQDLLEERGKVFGSRAELIARDQTLKTNAALTKERHQRAGITAYTWSTSRDERVRPMHADLEGEQFDWDDPPVTNDAGDQNHPGEDYQCRCVPLPVLDLGEEPEETAPEAEETPPAGPLPSLDLDEHFGRVTVERGATMTAEEVVADMQSEGIADWV
jgi:SPP1 gp7 family putative phage head morphogenesis protein